MNCHPSWHRLFVPVTFKQFLTLLLLQIYAIENLDLRAALAICEGQKLLIGRPTARIRMYNP
jgi:hypothetical protein